MKKFVSICLCACFTVLCMQIASADTISIDTSTATVAELTEAIEDLKKARLEKITEQFTSEYEVQPAEGIAFRGLSWGATREEVQKQVGFPHSFDRNHLINTAGKAYTNGLGIDDDYNGWSVAGYDVTYCDLFFVYPVIDDVLIRDDNVAQFYLAKYDIRGLGDINAALSDITDKLVNLYGNYTTDRYGDLTWTDQLGNTLILTTWSNCFKLTYYSADAENWLAAANHAVNLENAEKEEQSRATNQDNYDGL